MFKLPQADGLKSLQRLRSRRYAWILAALMLVVVLLTAWAMVGVRWYQSVTGTGKVIVYSPMDRVQEVDALIPGRLSH